MPFKDPEEQSRYYRERAERRKADPEYVAARNARNREMYTDPEYRERHRAYQREYRRNRRATDPAYGNMAAAESTRWSRKRAGIIYTPEQQVEFAALTGCEVCGTSRDAKPLHMDHCHDCHHYRGGLCARCNRDEGVLRRWQAACPPDSPMRAYLDRHVCKTE